MRCESGMYGRLGMVLCSRSERMRDRVDEVQVGHVGQVGHGAVLVSRVRSEMMSGFVVEKKFKFQSSSEKAPNLTFSVGFFT